MKYFFTKYFTYNCLVLCFGCKKDNTNKIKSHISSIRKLESAYLMAENLDDWIVKINGYKLHDNHLNTFRVENGILKVSYDQYDSFTDEFGHLFYKTPYTNYRLKLHYRFIGEQVTWR